MLRIHLDRHACIEEIYTLDAIINSYEYILSYLKDRNCILPIAGHILAMFIGVSNVISVGKMNFVKGKKIMRIKSM